MAVTWDLAVDCAHPAELAAFWARALGYVEQPPPGGAASWAEWFTARGVPESKWGDVAFLTDPDGRGPRISFMRVPEAKVVKNRLHLDVQVGGGRETPWEVRWPRVLEAVERLVAAGGAVIRQYDMGGKPDRVLMADPEGNEFCVI
ncbi:VOC family protein [Saccharothrix coeruleofusca]|uniref:Glyoxalase n=1 Tax=Saccharothrix coeruleofusca TaxID=33919 RepID=A0A918ALN6_9PSEU|nr:VOC family protein [Saccharothrix coeruleofusca]GGP56979.1 glyoxalase [Saccharothrix coeruleofusca]